MIAVRTIPAARTCSTFLFLAAVQAVALPAFWLFFLQEHAGPSYPVLIAAVLLADVGIASLGSAESIRACIARLEANPPVRHTLRTQHGRKMDKYSYGWNY